VFKVDVLFLEIMSSTNHLETLAGLVERELVEGVEN